VTTLPRGDWPDALLTCAQMGRADAWTIGNAYASGITLMENAGAAVARLVLARFGDAARALVLCGPGNNGGDGYVAAQVLREAGMAVSLHAFGVPRKDQTPRLRPDGAKVPGKPGCVRSDSAMMS
jgi:NAD(P)H-hydrate repair Nnr-like enzyme with NAD(P)H-hydrate epimerase domain